MLVVRYIIKAQVTREKTKMSL